MCDLLCEGDKNDMSTLVNHAIFLVRISAQTFRDGLRFPEFPLGGLTSTHNKQGCAILTKKVVPKNPGNYLKLRPKNPRTRNARLFFYMRKFTSQIRKSLISTPHLSFTYFVKGFYYLTFVL